MSYCAVAIPLICLLCFKYDFGIRGIWAGPSTAVAINTISYLIIFYCLDWDRLIAEAVAKRN